MSMQRRLLLWKTQNSESYTRKSWWNTFFTAKWMSWKNKFGLKLVFSNWWNWKKFTALIKRWEKKRMCTKRWENCTWTSMTVKMHKIISLRPSASGKKSTKCNLRFSTVPAHRKYLQKTMHKLSYNWVVRCC